MYMNVLSGVTMYLNKSSNVTDIVDPESTIYQVNLE